MKSANDINIKLAVLGCGDATKAAKACKPGGTVYDAYSRQGYALNCNPASLKRIMVRVVNRLFRVDKEGVDEALGEINDWVTKFNERQSNGLATLRTKPSDIPGGHDMFDSVTIVFRAADVATRKCGPRVYFIDAAYLAYERKDLRLGILEGTTSSNKIVPVAIHLGWGETTEFYCDMIEGIQAYSENGDDGEDTLWRHLDDKKTCLIGDRHSGLKAACKAKFIVANMRDGAPSESDGHAMVRARIVYAAYAHSLSTLLGDRHGV